jgi:hypothetical protein
MEMNQSYSVHAGACQCKIIYELYQNYGLKQKTTTPSKRKACVESLEQFVKIIYKGHDTKIRTSIIYTAIQDTDDFDPMTLSTQYKGKIHIWFINVSTTSNFITDITPIPISKPIEESVG